MKDTLTSGNVGTGRVCEICGSSRNTPVQAPWNVWRCLDCGFVFATDHDTNGASEGLYEEAFARDNKHPTYIFDGTKYVPRATERWNRLLQRLDHYRNHGRILDIGCSLGFLLHQAQELGWEPYGLEVSAYAAQYAREKFGIAIHQGTLEDDTYPPSSFDAVICSHVLEHVLSPRTLLRRIHAILRPGGVLLILVPTQFSSLSYKLLGTVRGEGPPRHLSFFSRRTLSSLLRQEKFQLLKCEMNTQLVYLVYNATKSKQIGAKCEETSEEMVSTPSQSVWKQLRKTGVYAVKALVNSLGTSFDFGDELAVYAQRKGEEG